jgi:hypothetical protein
MARLIEFYVPKSFRKPLRSAHQPQPAKVLEFRSPSNQSTERSPFIIWRLVESRKQNAARSV